MTSLSLGRSDGLPLAFLLSPLPALTSLSLGGNWDLTKDEFASLPQLRGLREFRDIQLVGASSFAIASIIRKAPNLRTLDIFMGSRDLKPIVKALKESTSAPLLDFLLLRGKIQPSAVISIVEPRPVLKFFYVAQAALSNSSVAKLKKHFDQQAETGDSNESLDEQPEWNTRALIEPSYVKVQRLPK